MLYNLFVFLNFFLQMINFASQLLIDLDELLIF